MPGSPVQRLGKLLGRLQRGLAEARHTHRLRCRRALLAALVVARPGVGVAVAGVERDQRVAAELERHRLHVERAEVDPQRPVGLAQERRQLVEQAGLRAHPVVLDPRADLGQLDAVPLGLATERDHRQRQRDLERGRRRQPGTAGDVPGDPQPGAAHGHPSALELGRGPAHERPPPASPRRIGQLEAVAAREVDRDRLDPRCAERLPLHGHALADRERERQPEVVVGVLSDQVDPTGSEHGDAITQR